MHHKTNCSSLYRLQFVNWLSAIRSQAVTAYSKVDLTYVRYRSSLILRQQFAKFLLTKLNTEFAFLHTLPTCWLKDSLESIDTPRYLAHSAIVSCFHKGVSSRVIDITIHLSMLKDIFHIFSHSSKSCRSSCKALTSVKLSILLYSICSHQCISDK